jgi:hypothetical protein
VEVEPDFSPRNHAFTGFAEFFDQRLRFVVIEACVVRMDANRGVDPLMPPAHVNRAFEHSAVGIAGAHVQDCSHSGCVRAFEHFITIRVELRTINVRVRVDEHPSS